VMIIHSAKDELLHLGGLFLPYYPLTHLCLSEYGFKITRSA
jgi:hypothetical protein